MTEGTKSSREQLAGGPAIGFAPLSPLVAGGDAAAAAEGDAGARGLAEALSGFEAQCRIRLRLVQGDEDLQTVDVQPGSLAADDGEPDVIAVMSPETWAEIAAGRLAPYDALFGGRLRVGGDVELAKRVTQHLSDPAYPYVAPC